MYCKRGQNWTLTRNASELNISVFYEKLVKSHTTIPVNFSVCNVSKLVTRFYQERFETEKTQIELVPYVLCKQKSPPLYFHFSHMHIFCRKGKYVILLLICTLKDSHRSILQVWKVCCNTWPKYASMDIHRTHWLDWMFRRYCVRVNSA